MARRIRAEIGVDAADACLVAASSAEVEGTISDVVRSSVPDENGTYVEEFTLNGGATLDRSDVEAVFSTDSHTVYRFAPDVDDRCVCRALERFGCPISNFHAREGTLYVTFHAPDIELVQDIVATLQEGFSGVHVRHLARSDGGTDTDFVLVDRNHLTRKQRQVLETAHEMGYFEHPKRTNAAEVADALDIAPSTFTEHLAAAQRKVLETLLRS